MHQSAFSRLGEGSQRGPSAFCALDNAMRDALTNVVLFSDWAASANPVQRNIHIGKRSCVETTFNHCNLPNLIDATKTGFTDLDVGKSSAVPARQHATVRD